MSLFGGLIRHRLLAECRSLVEHSGVWPHIITSYPKFAPFVGGMRKSSFVYYNQDDNRITSPKGELRELETEWQMIAGAQLVLCASRYQTERFRTAVPARAHAMHHFPHGIDLDVINPNPDRPPATRRVLVFGALSFRYDWNLILNVVRGLPDVEFLFLGEVALREPGEPVGWREKMRDVLALPNVNRRSMLTSQENARLVWDSACNWLPYDTTQQFNLARCPLKLYTGLASGRPVVSPELPECQLHPNWVQVYQGTEGATRALREAVNPDSLLVAASKALAQVQFARQNSWDERARQLVALLDSSGESATIGSRT